VSEQTIESSQDVPAQWALGETFVPKGRYTDPDFLALEYERLFPYVWQPACREEEIADPGDYLDYEIGKQSVLVTRQEDGAIKAFHNACRHRGMKLAGGAGCVKEFRCRFHGWRYDLDGTSTFVHCREEFADRPDEDWNLTPVHVATWGGWVFISMAEEPEPFEEWIEPVASSLEPFRLEDMRFRWRKRTILPANWKTVLDAFIEGYHTPGTHPQTMRYTEALRPSAKPAPPEEFSHAPFTPSFTFENHSRFIFGQRPESAERDAERQARMAQPDVYARTMQYQHLEVHSLVTERDYRAADKLAEMESVPVHPFLTFQELCEELAREEGVDYPSMSLEEYMNGNGDWHVFPDLVLLVEKSCVLGYRIRPCGDDPDRCIFDMFSLEHFPPDAIPETKWQFFENWRDHDDWGQLPGQDLKNIADIQAGLHSLGFEGHWLNTVQETAVHNQHVIADRYLFPGDG